MPTDPTAGAELKREVGPDTDRGRQGAQSSSTPSGAGVDSKVGEGGNSKAGEEASKSAIAALKADHQRVDALFNEYELAASGRKARIVKQICQELVIHTALEEEIFYPACRQAATDEDPLDEAQVEHDSAKSLIADLMRGTRADRYRDAKISVLAEQIRHHVAEEEKPAEGIFAKAQAAGLDTSDLAERLQTRRQELQANPNELPAPKPVSFQTSTPAEASKEDQMARGDSNRDEGGRFSSDNDRGGRGGGGRSSGRNDDDRTSRSRSRDDDDGRGWYGDREGHAEAARRGWAERAGESRSFSRDDADDRRGGRGGSRDRDERGRFASDDEDDRRYRSHSRDDDDDGRRGGRGGSPDRDERGRFTRDDDDDRRYRSRGRDDDDDDRGGPRGGSRDRDERGRFTSDDDDDRRYRSRSRDDDDGDRRGGQGGSRDRDERGRFASDDEDDRRYRSRSRNDDADDRGARSSSSGRSQGGWFGDPRGHAEAARRGWEERGGSRTSSRDDDDDDRGRGSSRSRSRNDDDDDRDRGRSRNSQGGWFGDSEGHAQAARRGWEDRR